MVNVSAKCSYDWSNFKFALWFNVKRYESILSSEILNEISPVQLTAFARIIKVNWFYGFRLNGRKNPAGFSLHAPFKLLNAFQIELCGYQNIVFNEFRMHLTLRHAYLWISKNKEINKRNHRLCRFLSAFNSINRTMQALAPEINSFLFK